MTEQQQQQQSTPLYTVTVEMTHHSPDWLTVGATTDTLAHLVEWAAPANPQIPTNQTARSALDHRNRPPVRRSDCRST